jgi:hypothetical protein
VFNFAAEHQTLPLRAAKCPVNSQGHFRVFLLSCGGQVPVEETTVAGLTHAYSLLLDAACILATSAEPFEDRLGRASRHIQSIPEHDLDNHPELKERLEELKETILSFGSEYPSGSSSPEVNSEKAELIATAIFNLFLDTSKIFNRHH